MALGNNGCIADLKDDDLSIYGSSERESVPLYNIAKKRI